MIPAAIGRYGRILRFLGITALLLSIGAPAPLRAATTADAKAAIATRQQAMKDMAAAAKTIHGFMNGTASQADAAKAASQLTEIVAKVPNLFPPGTSQQDFPGLSAAKPEIWDNPDDMASLEDVLNKDAAALKTAVATGNTGQTSDAFATLGHDACGACHQTYRGKSN